MICPKCSGEYHCPCKNCGERNSGKVTWTWATDNGPIRCGHCGHEMSFGEWEMEMYRQYDAAQAAGEKA